jgi:tripartite ATP-independent transporter DctM subunit
MDWVPTLIGIVIMLVILLATGMPIGFGFIVLALIGYFVWVGGTQAWVMLHLGTLEILTSFVLLPIPFFILMAEVLYHSGMLNITLDAVDSLTGKVRARLLLVSVFTGTIMAMSSGSSMGTTAALGASLVPEMDRRGYDRSLSMGTIMGSGGLAMIIPPSAMGVLVAVIGKIDVGKLLLGMTIPGFVLATFYIVYILLRVYLNPRLAPSYEEAEVSLIKRLLNGLNILPMGILFIVVLGSIFFCIATPTESSALGVVGAFIVALAYKKLSLESFKKSVLEAAKLIGMMFFVAMGAKVFSMLLAGAGVTTPMVGTLSKASLSPWMMLIIMQLIVLFLGCLMESIAIMMITIPIFMPIIISLGFNPVWFGVIFMLNAEIGGWTPPIGMLAYVMKGVCPLNVTMGQVFRAAVPFVLMELAVMVLIMVFPALVLWLPSVAAQ